MEILDWTPKSDLTLKSKEIEIHNTYHSDLAKKGLKFEELFETKTRKMRIKALRRAIELAQIKVEGEVLDVGAGDGWCSAYLLKNFPNISRAYAMEINDAAVNDLIPQTILTGGGDLSKAVAVKGSFNDIKLKNHFSVVTAMGALHHSANLGQTFKNIFDALKPGGWLLAQEPYMINSTPNSFYENRNREEVNFKGLLNISNSERTDVFYRECEYMVAGYHAGFNFNFEFVPKNYSKGGLFKKPEAIISEDKPNNMIIYAQKPTDASDSPPLTAW